MMTKDENSQFPRKTTTIIVAGMHRSGTSLTASILQAGGINMGERLVGKGIGNEKGHFEDLHMVDFHKEVLLSKGIEINGLTLVSQIPVDENLHLRALDLIEARSENPLWGWKDPRTTLFLDFWDSLLPDAYFVMIYRSPWEVIESLYRRGTDEVISENPEIAAELWKNYNQKILAFYENHADRCLLINVSRVIDDSSVLISGIYQKFGIQLSMPDIQIIDKDIFNVHSTQSEIPEFLEACFPDVIKLYAALENKAQPFASVLSGPIEMSENGYSGSITNFWDWQLQVTKNLNSQHYAQLYFREKATDFSENNSLRLVVFKQTTLLKFRLNGQKKVTQFRFDPLNDYAKIRINSIQLLIQGKPIDIELKLSSNAMYSEKGAYLFDTTDPQVFIDFPDEVSVELDEVIIELEYLQKGHEAFPELLKHKNIEIGLSNAKTIFLSESLQSSEYRNDCLQREVAENNILIRKQAENIGIQNGLLSSLKTSNEEILKQFNTLEMEIKRQNSELLNIKNSFSFKLSRLLKIPLLLFRPFKLIVLIKGTLKLNRSITLIKHSGYFDKEYYLLNNPDVKSSGIPAINHYLFFGGFEGRKPGKEFDSAFYLEQYPDVKVSEMNPLIHYIRFGKNECRLIHNTESDASLELNKKNSTSGPLQRILGTPGKIWQKMKSTVTVVPAIIKRHGGVKNTLKKSLVFFRKNGVKSGLIKMKNISNLPKSFIQTASQTSRKEEGNNESDSSVFCINKSSSNAIQFTNETILFIGHDALLAGAQILLLSLIKWFSEHTGIGIKIILLRNGNLLDRFAQIAPTLIWEDLVLRYPDKVKRKEILSEFVGKVDLVYGNTVVVPTIYDELEYLNVPFITHVHELEKSIKLYIDKAALTKMKRLTSCFIGCSNPVSENLIVNHDVARKKVSTIHAFIEDKHIKFTDPKKEIRSKLGIANNGLIVICCGTIYWRKGADLFVETAVKFKQKGHTHFHFYWIGENFWDLDYASSSICSWKDIELKIIKNDLQNHITFLGVKNNVFDYLLASDIFYLTSREDPFPLVCLEAAQCGIPIICFADAGGIPDFVENDAGFVVPFEEIDAATEKIISLDIDINLRKELGAKARKKFLSRHSIDIAAPEILSLCQRIGHLKPLVSVIVPNYNYGKYLEQRIDSILNQSFSDFEIIVLDDASSDNSGEIMEKYLHLSNIRMIKNTSNSGNTFKQWHKGFMEAKGDIIWFAEADDYCEPDFLRKLLPCFNNPRVAIAFCDSLIIDSEGNITGNYDSYLESLDPVHWKSSYQVSGQKEINFGLGVKNSIPNASAVLFRKNSISEHIFNETINFRFSGDWYFYTQILNGNHIAFCAEKLNYHRKHNQTVTSSFNTQKSDLLLKEASLIHDNILEKYSLSTVYLKKWEFYIGEQIQAFYPSASKADFDKYYPYSLIEEKINNTLNKNKQSKRLVFITTNDGSSNGGSEKLWRQAATECRKRGHNVMVVIKKWQPEPFFIENFKSIGISVIFKERDHFNELLGFNPDLVVISIGDQDEGIDYYEKCITNKIPYLIVNQLTKEPAYWPVRADISDQVRKGYLGAEIVMFTGKNNHELMERRINSKISNAGIFYNPFDIDRNSNIPFPSIDDGLRIALPANLVREHKGQHLAIELFSLKKWRDRRVYLNLYGKGHDEDALMKQAKHYHLTNVTFHGYTEDIRSVWEHNHAIFLSSFMEGLPLVLVGAMICGRVPIVTDIGAHREVIDDNISGFIAAKPTVEALDEALERAYQDRERWKEIGFEARKKILSIVPHDPVDDFILKILPFAEKENN